MSEENFHRAVPRAMPNNPAHVPGDFSGLWRVVICKRRGTSDGTEEIVGEQGLNSTYTEAVELSAELNREFAGE